MARIPGEGLAKGLAVTLRHMVNKSVTQQYPEVQPELPPRSRGVIALVEENCTVCMLCARECPDWCIYIDSHKETLPAPEGGRPRARNVLDRFAIDFSLCMYCGICIEVCPFDALFWSPEFEYAEHDILDLLHEKERLGSWVETVPPPPAHEVGAEPPKEIAAAERPARPSTGKTAEARPRRTEPADRTPGPAAESAPPREAGAAGEERPRRMAARDVRAIRPPGALPKKPEPEGAPPEEAEPRKPEAPESGTGGEEPPKSAARPERPGPEERPRRMTSANIRAIRPPGALPKKPEPKEPEPEEPESAEPESRRPEAQRPENGRGDEPPERPGSPDSGDSTS
ncbi:4Fe-4S binding protein [Sinosporangium siamense]|uniref:4Fe-4S binding protein n=1 Tax=Sinosporangium siamense TaxID=1367973 RepID=UPI0035EA8833